MAPAIRLAREVDTAARSTYFKNGEPLGSGELLVQPRLAATLERIAQDGADGFLKGAIAARLAQDLQAGGGLITENDLARYPVATMIPLCAEWRGYTVLSAPPPMGGSAMLELL